jgi:hypothetical protein
VQLGARAIIKEASNYEHPGSLGRVCENFVAAAASWMSISSVTYLLVYDPAEHDFIVKRWSLINVQQ